MNQITWQENEVTQSALWRSESQAKSPKQVIVIDDTCSADVAYKKASDGVGMLWRGDFQNARLMLQALARRLDKIKTKPSETLFEAFHKHRQSQIHRARILSLILIELDEQYTVHLRRAPDVRQACEQVYGAANGRLIVSLRELQGLIGAYEWRKKGVYVAALDDLIHPYYGVFSPVRGEYVDLVARAPLPQNVSLAYDIGVGSGVLSAVLAKRGVGWVLATDQDERALSCARENLTRMGLLAQVDLQVADLFPQQAAKAQLIVCNPPWLPAKANSPIDHAVYDPDSRMLKGFLSGVAQYLAEHGEAWLILSDLAEHLQLRSRAQLLEWIEAGGLKVLGRLDVQPKHKKAFDPNDALHSARAKEVTSLWRLAAA